MTPVAPFWGPTLDCPDPMLLATFYQRVCGGTLRVTSDDLTELRLPNVNLGFQRVEDHRAPTWPDGEVPQQCHLDFSATDLDAAEVAVLAAGAGKASFQPAPESFRVFFDPAGHPFCLSTWGTSAGPPEGR